jgi:hypothetical protein
MKITPRTGKIRQKSRIRDYKYVNFKAGRMESE